MAEMYTELPGLQAIEPEMGRDLCRVKRYEMYAHVIGRDEAKYGGYRIEVLTEKLTERDKAVLICKVCQGIMKEACVSNSGEQNCSCCERDLYPRQTPNLSVREMIVTLKCSCPLSLRGCEWLGTLKDCEDHLDTCGYVYETCRLRCGVTLTRDEIKIHVRETCEQRKVHCEHCLDIVKSCEIPEHLKQCPDLILSCDLCGNEKCRKDMTEHVNYYCPENETDCPFVKYKCLTRMKRKDIDKHLEEKETKHLGLKLTAMEDLITKQNDEMGKQIKELRAKNESTLQQIELLYSITDTTKIILKIEDVTNPKKGWGYMRRNNLCVPLQTHSLESGLCNSAGHSFRFQFRDDTLSIIFPKSKYSKPFLAKPTIVLLTKQIKCDTVEVKQEELRRGCERTIVTLSKVDIEMYSELRSPDDTKKDLTLEIYLAMQ